jgi:hypothetical protein
MADAGVSELFMLLRACDDRRVLEEIYNRGGGATWDRYSCDRGIKDAPLSEWGGVTADADGNATALELDGVEISLSGLVALILFGNQITDAGAAALAETLPGSQVTTLDLDNNQITDAGAAALAEALPGSQVTTLDLDDNRVTGPWLQRVRGVTGHGAKGAAEGQGAPEAAAPMSDEDPRGHR